MDGLGRGGGGGGLFDTGNYYARQTRYGSVDSVVYITTRPIGKIGGKRELCF
jgi:hypothetical protein